MIPNSMPTRPARCPVPAFVQAPHFMRTITDLVLPSPYSRMGLPPLRTRNKERAEELNSNALETFIAEQCYNVAGGWWSSAPSTSGSSTGCRRDAATRGRRVWCWTRSNSVSPTVIHEQQADDRQSVDEPQEAQPGTKPWTVVDNWLMREGEPR